MSSSYRESSNKAKAVRAGILDARPVSKGQKNKIKDWLIVSVRSKNLGKDYSVSERCYVGIIDIYGEYASEDIARHALPYRDPTIYADSIWSKWSGNLFIIHRKTYEETYKPLWKSLFELDKIKLIREKQNGLVSNA